MTKLEEIFEKKIHDMDSKTNDGGDTCSLYQNNSDNARDFIEKQSQRKSPNHRVNGDHFLEISNNGFELFCELINSEKG